MSNPVFEITMRMTTDPHPFGKSEEALTNMDMATVLGRIIRLDKDIKKVIIISFKKIEFKSIDPDAIDEAVNNLCSACMIRRRRCPGPCEEYLKISDPTPIEMEAQDESSSKK